MLFRSFCRWLRRRVDCWLIERADARLAPQLIDELLKEAPTTHKNQLAHVNALDGLQVRQCAARLLPRSHNKATEELIPLEQRLLTLIDLLELSGALQRLTRGVNFSQNELFRVRDAAHPDATPDDAVLRQAADLITAKQRALNECRDMVVDMLQPSSGLVPHADRKSVV